MDSASDTFEQKKATSEEVKLGEKLFQWRDYTPIPLALLVIFASDPSVISATLGTLVVVFGELIRIYSVAFIGSISRTRKDRTGGKIVDTGPYGMVRNPLYVGNFLIVFGIAIFSAKFWLILLTCALFAFQYYFIVKYEENFLRKSFGAEFDAYCQKVPAWVPRRVRLEEMEWPTSYTKALRSERRTLTAIAVILFLIAI